MKKKQHNSVLASLCWLVMFVLGCFAEQQAAAPQAVSALGQPAPAETPRPVLSSVEIKGGPWVSSGFFHPQILSGYAKDYMETLTDYESMTRIDTTLRMEVQMRGCKSFQAQTIHDTQIASLSTALLSLKRLLEAIDQGIREEADALSEEDVIKDICPHQSCGEDLARVRTRKLRAVRAINQMRLGIPAAKASVSYWRAETVVAVKYMRDMSCPQQQPPAK
jgi:hypothetical protein